MMTDDLLGDGDVRQHDAQHRRAVTEELPGGGSLQRSHLHPVPAAQARDHGGPGQKVSDGGDPPSARLTSGPKHPPPRPSTLL